MSAGVVVALSICGYFMVGATCMAYRAYKQAEWQQQNRVSYHDDDYKMALAFAFALWPFWLIAACMSGIARTAQARGDERLRQRLERQAQTRREQDEQARLLREQGLDL